MWTGVALAEPDDADLSSRLEITKSHLRVLAPDEDELIAGYLAAAVAHVEGVTGSRIYAVEAELVATSWADLQKLPVAPIGEEVTITYTPLGVADPVTLSPSPVVVRVDPLSPRILPAIGTAWPASDPGQPITVTTTAGYDALPAVVWQAVLLLAGHYYRNRMASVIGTISSDLPHGVYALLANHKRHLQ